MENWNPRSPSKPRLVDEAMVAVLKDHFDQWLSNLTSDNHAKKLADPNYIGFSCGPFERVETETASNTSDLVRHILRLRRLRDELFPGGLFVDPIWDLLLDLYKAGLEHRPISVSSACIAANAPPTTALRHIRTMEEAGLLQRNRDPFDNRRIYLALTPSAQFGMARWIDAMCAPTFDRVSK